MHPCLSPFVHNIVNLGAEDFISHTEVFFHTLMLSSAYRLAVTWLLIEYFAISHRGRYFQGFLLCVRIAFRSDAAEGVDRT